MSRFFQGYYYDNLGITYNSPTFTIHGADGRALSVENPAVVVLSDKNSQGSFVKYQVTANQSFQDSSGVSDIIGNTFSTTTLIAWADVVPFFIYAVGNDAQDTIQFMIGRVPHSTLSPADASIGAPDDPVANSQTSFWSLNNIDETLFDNNPCISIGSFQMSKDASDDWTVAPLVSQQGIGLFGENFVYVMPISQNGAALGSHFKNSGGTAPTFSTSQVNYTLDKYGFCQTVFFLLGATDGVGNGRIQLAAPLQSSTLYESSIQFTDSIMYTDASTSNFFDGVTLCPENASTNILMQCNDINISDGIRNNDVDVGDGIRGSIIYNTDRRA